MARTTQEGSTAAGGRRRRQLAAAAALFLLALGLRLFFWQATPDAGWSYTAYYKGDAPTWLEYARAIRDERPFELGLPLRPPGNGYLIAALWDGTREDVRWLRAVWCALGALAVVLFYGAVRRSFGSPAALVAGLWASASTGLLILSTSLNNETPYLVLVAAILYLWPTVRRGRRPGVLFGWGLLNAVACLVRVEHALFFALLMAYLALFWARGERGWSLRPSQLRPSLRPVAAVAAAFVLALVPWHAGAWRAIERFNSTPIPLEPGPERAYRQVEAATAYLAWEPAAQEERRRLPAFVRRVAADFVAATVLVRGGDRVRPEDFAVLEQAFGYRGEPLGGHPFVALYGGLNFCLANNPRATGGFDRSPLEQPPPLAGGASRYPLVMVQGLPPPDLAFLYLPHLEIVNRGYRLGWRWIRGHPGDFLALAGRKLAIFWQGAALGLTGYGLPLETGGLRRVVDLVVPQGTFATLWRLALLALVAVGVYRTRRNATAMPWTLFLLSKVVVTVAFFGYARQGATVIPVVAILAALALLGPRGKEAADREGASRRWLIGALAAGVLLAAVETVRWASGPEVRIDGRPVVGADPIPGDEHADRRVEVR